MKTAQIIAFLKGLQDKADAAGRAQADITDTTGGPEFANGLESGFSSGADFVIQTLLSELVEKPITQKAEEPGVVVDVCAAYTIGIGDKTQYVLYDFTNDKPDSGVLQTAEDARDAIEHGLAVYPFRKYFARKAILKDGEYFLISENAD